MRPGRYTALDIGTVTCRMLVAEVSAAADGPCLRPLLKEYAITDLGKGVDATHHLSAAALERVMAALDQFLAARAALPAPEDPTAFVAPPCVVATSATRDADNADEFAQLLAKRGLELTVIPGSREAALSFLGASEGFTGEQLCVVDVGGGSTEVILGKGGEDPVALHSFDIGCRRVTERFLADDPPTELQMEAARAWMHQQFQEWRAQLEEQSVVSPDRMVAVAGTATSAVSIREAMAVYDSARVHGSEVTIDQLQEITHTLASLALAERRQVVGLDPGRAPVIVAGMLILEEVMRVFNMSAFTVSESDILQGIILNQCK